MSEREYPTGSRGQPGIPTESQHSDGSVAEREPGLPLVLLLAADSGSYGLLFAALSPRYALARVTDPQQVLCTALDRTPTLVVIDVTEPGPSAEALTQALLRSFRGHSRLAQTPVLCVTAGADTAGRARLLRAGADDCLLAPFAVEEVRARVDNVVAARRAHAAQERLNTRGVDEVRERLLGRPLVHERACAVWRAFNTRASVLLQVTPDRPQAEEVGDELLRAVQAARIRSIVAVPLCVGDDRLGVLSLGSASRALDARDVRLAEELGRRCALFIKNARLHEAERHAIQIRDDILGIVAHDLRNPLNSICLHLNLLLRRRGDSDGRWTQPAEMIRSAALRMDRIIQDLLDVVRLESGGLSIELRQLPASQVLADAVEAQRPIAAAASIRLALEPGPVRREPRRTSVRSLLPVRNGNS
ncbi:MAG: histidine kinase dimerization/phospho-acceptor domain-containing protein [Polyangia bacterium]